MGSTPVANPSPPRRWRFSRSIIPLAFLALAVIALIAIGVAVVWPSDGADSEWTALARADELDVNEPLAVEGDVYLVLLESGEILALSQIDPTPTSAAKFRLRRTLNIWATPAGSGTPATARRTT